MPNATNSVAIFTRAAQMLAEADTIQKTHELKDLALTAADWARRRAMGDEAVQYARSYALAAERKMGEMLAQTERDKGGRPPETGNATLPVSTSPTLADLGLTKRDSAEAQKLAALPEESFERVRSGDQTRAEALREQSKRERKPAPELPPGKFRVLYADPPWLYGDKLIEGYGAAEHHYPPMSVAELCAMPVSERAAADAALFLWVTSPMLAQCWPVIEAWGFRYVASFVWDKVRHNYGHYNSVRHEFLLVCVRGSCLPETKELIDSVQSIERSARHSEKPEEFRRIIETMYPTGPKLELFARKAAPGWTAWGDEMPHGE